MRRATRRTCQRQQHRRKGTWHGGGTRPRAPSIPSGVGVDLDETRQGGGRGRGRVVGVTFTVRRKARTEAERTVREPEKPKVQRRGDKKVKVGETMTSRVLRFLDTADAATRMRWVPAIARTVRGEEGFRRARVRSAPHGIRIAGATPPAFGIGMSSPRRGGPKGDGAPHPHRSRRRPAAEARRRRRCRAAPAVVGRSHFERMPHCTTVHVAPQHDRSQMSG